MNILVIYLRMVQSTNILGIRIYLTPLSCFLLYFNDTMYSTSPVWRNYSTVHSSLSIIPSLIHCTNILLSNHTRVPSFHVSGVPLSYDRRISLTSLRLHRYCLTRLITLSSISLLQYPRLTRNLGKNGRCGGTDEIRISRTSTNIENLERKIFKHM